VYSPTAKEGFPRQPTEDATAFRPVHRPPIALVTLLDDGQRVGETFRLRAGRLTLGRTDGDVKIPHDSMISTRHAEVVWVENGGQYLVRDLGSTNGTFARIDECLLRDGQEILLGSRRYRFEVAAELGIRTESEQTTVKGTMPWRPADSVGTSSALAFLIEILPDAEGRRIPLDYDSQTIGRSHPSCDVPLVDDPYLSAVQATIQRDDRNRWQIISASECLNGVWLRFQATSVAQSGHFHIGEQRFTVRVL
jgi:hypothetical protein